MHSDDGERPLFTTAALKELGLRPRTGEYPAKIELWRNYNGSGTRHYWRLDQAVEIKRRVLVPVMLDHTVENILLAIWSVNRAAKRRRDAAESAYENSQHGFAHEHKTQKQTYYDLKDRGIAWLAHHRHLLPAYRHAQLVVWVHAEYRFHSRLAPLPEVELPEISAELVRMEAKQPGTKELRLLDAITLLRSLADHTAAYTRITPAWSVPSRSDLRVREADEDDDEEERTELAAIYAQQAVIDARSKEAQRRWPAEWAAAVALKKHGRKARRELRDRVGLIEARAAAKVEDTR